MEINARAITAGLGLTLLVGVYIGQKYAPVGETKTVEVVKDRIVTRIVHVKSPDGTETTETTKTEDKNKEKNSDVVTAKPLPQWMIAVGVNTNQVQNLSVTKRVAGPFLVGGSLATDKTAEVHIGFEF